MNHTMTMDYNNTPPPTEIKVVLKEGTKEILVSIHTSKLRDSPNYLFKGQIIEEDGKPEVIFQSMSWPTEDQVKDWYQVYKRDRAKRDKAAAKQHVVK